MADFDAYRRAHTAVIGLLGGLTRADLVVPCPATPGWTVGDVVAHMVHLLDTAAKGSVPDDLLAAAVDDPDSVAAERDRIAQDGVATFRELDISNLLGHWGSLVARAPDAGAGLAADVAAHLFDIAEAVGTPLIDDGQVRIALRGFAPVHRNALAARGVGPVRLEIADWGTDIGPADATLSVSGPAYEMSRAMLGRLTPDEADEVLDWSGATGEVRALFPLYGLTAWQSSL